MARCFYCLRDQPLTLAHLFESRFREAMPIANPFGVYLSSANDKRGGAYKSLHHSGSILQTKVRALCGACNSAWMQPIEALAGVSFREFCHAERIPTPIELVQIAKWWLVVAALSSELHASFDLPELHRTAIRNARQLPENYAVFAIWTSDLLPSLQSDMFRARLSSDRGSDPTRVAWVGSMQTGNVALIAASPYLYGRVAKVLDDAGLESVLGVLGPNIIYSPAGFSRLNTWPHRPDHSEVRDALFHILDPSPKTLQAENGQIINDLRTPRPLVDVDFKYDFTNRLLPADRFPSPRA